MNTHSDFEEFLKLLSEERTEFLIIGGYNATSHGQSARRFVWRFFFVLGFLQGTPDTHLLTCET